MGIDCCRDAGRDESCCDMSTIEGDQVREACDDVIHSLELLRDLPDTLDDGMLIARYIDVQQVIAELTRIVVEYGEPDAGMEPLG